MEKLDSGELLGIESKCVTGSGAGRETRDTESKAVETEPNHQGLFISRFEKETVLVRLISRMTLQGGGVIYGNGYFLFCFMHTLS